MGMEGNSLAVKGEDRGLEGWEDAGRDLVCI